MPPPSLHTALMEIWLKYSHRRGTPIPKVSHTLGLSNIYSAEKCAGREYVAFVGGDTRGLLYHFG